MSKVDLFLWVPLFQSAGPLNLMHHTFLKIIALLGYIILDFPVHHNWLACHSDGDFVRDQASLLMRPCFNLMVPVITIIVQGCFSLMRLPVIFPAALGF